ncbi:MAG: rhodanese-like domain-containing protein [Bacteroidota bacterium]
MKELEKTKRISVSAVLFLLVLVIGFLTFKKPENIFDNNASETLEKVVKREHIVSLDEFNKMDKSQYAIIDTRSNYEFAKGHIEGAINVSPHQAFDEETTDLFQNFEDEGTTLIIYSDNPDRANNAWMFLYQLGYENIKMLSVETSYVNKQFQCKNISIEKPVVNYAKFMDSATSVKEIEAAPKPKPKPKKKVITAPKKKKRAPEGGC